MKRMTFIAAIGAALLAAASANAAQLRFDLLEARWDNPVGGNILAIDNTFGDPVIVSWGQDGLIPNVTSSGYDFNARPTPFEEAPDDVFALGSFTHFNNPITAGTAITSVDLFLRGSLTVVDGMIETFIGEKTFDFTFFHNETPNSVPGDICPDTGTAEPCADVVDVSAVAGTDTFFVGDVEYTLNILGFSTSIADAENGIFTTSFFSDEGANNNRILAASFTTDIPSAIPLPAGMWLLLGGMGALAGFRKYGHRKA